MRKRIVFILFAVCIMSTMQAQNALKKDYDEQINPMSQIDAALVQAKEKGKFVVCQVGGN